MIVIPRVTDKIPVKIGELKFLVSPLSVEHKFKLSEYMKLQGGEEKQDNYKMAVYSVKYALKGIEGACTMDGKPYQLEFDTDGSLSDNCLSEVTNILGNDKLAAACIAVGMGRLDQQIEGVEIEVPGSKKK